MLDYEPVSSHWAQAFVSGKSGARGLIFSIMNMDAQDAQDEQDERFLHEKLAQPMTRCGLADAQDYKLAVSRKNPVHPVHPC